MEDYRELCRSALCVWTRLWSDVCAEGDTSSGCRPLHLLLPIAIWRRHLVHLGNITELLALWGCSCTSQVWSLLQSQCHCQSSLKALCIYSYSIYYWGNSWSWPPGSPWDWAGPCPQQGGGLGHVSMLRGAAQACRVLAWRCGGLQARLFLKDLLGVIEGRRGFDGKLECRTLMMRGRCSALMGSLFMCWFHTKPWVFSLSSVAV